MSTQLVTCDCCLYLLQNIVIRNVVPEFDDLTLFDAPDVDNRPSDRFAGGQHALQRRLMGAVVGDIGRHQLILHHPEVDRGDHIGKIRTAC